MKKQIVCSILFNTNLFLKYAPNNFKNTIMFKLPKRTKIDSTINEQTNVNKNNKNIIPLFEYKSRSFTNICSTLLGTMNIFWLYQSINIYMQPEHNTTQLTISLIGFITTVFGIYIYRNVYQKYHVIRLIKVPTTNTSWKIYLTTRTYFGFEKTYSVPNELLIGLPYTYPTSRILTMSYVYLCCILCCL